MEVKEEPTDGQSIVQARRATHGEAVYTLRAATEAMRLLTGVAEDQENINPVLLQCLNMICFKIARAMNGNQMHEDHWLDVAGYAEIALEEIKREKNSSQPLTLGQKPDRV